MSGNSSGWTDGNRIRRQLSKEKCSSPQLESIKEENKRKQVIQELGRSAADDNIDIFFRRPVDIQKDSSDHRISTSADNTQNIYVTSPDSGPHSITSTFRRSPSRRDKIEIDSDNIETPPVTRKAMAGVNSGGDSLDNAINKSLLENDNEAALGNGQFDRFSSARKTRRYKRPTLSNAGSDVDQTATPEPNEKNNNTSKVYIEPKSPPVLLEQKNLAPSNEDKESRLKRWQERLKSLDDHSAMLESPTPTNTTSRSSSRKSLNPGGTGASGLNTDEVNNAVHYLQRQQSNRSNNKVINVELNDEGFEESQSLVSDTPSQGKGDNSGTDTNEAVGMTSGGPPVKRMNSSESAMTTTSNDSKTATGVPAAGKTTISGIKARKTPGTTRTQSLRSASATRSSAGTPCPRPNLPIRNHSLRKNDSESGILKDKEKDKDKRNDVQKSNSRNSLLSSRSSLNSAASVSTVKRAPTSTTTKSGSSFLDVKKPLGSVSSTSSLASRLNTGIKTTPATRSTIPAANNSTSLSSMRSSNLTSASAAAQQLREQLKRPTSGGGGSSSSESVNNRLNLSSSNVTSNYPLKGSNSGGLSSTNHSINNSSSFTNRTSNNNNLNSVTRPGGLTRKGSSGSNFMRPTASSVTKAAPSVTLGANSSAAQKPSRFR